VTGTVARAAAGAAARRSGEGNGEGSGKGDNEDDGECSDEGGGGTSGEGSNESSDGGRLDESKATRERLARTRLISYQSREPHEVSVQYKSIDGWNPMVITQGGGDVQMATMCYCLCRFFSLLIPCLSLLLLSLALGCR
jgi:hypothetical protein